MFKQATLILAMLLVAGAAHAQSPLSPPERPPVPMTEADQRRVKEPSAGKGIQDSGAKSAVINVPSKERHLSSGNASVDAIVLDAAARYGLDPCLILSVMKMESGFKPLA